MGTTQTSNGKTNGKANGKGKAAKLPPNLAAGAKPMTSSSPLEGPAVTPPADDKPSWKKQQEIPGTERPTVPELDKKAAEYVARRDKRAALQVGEKQDKVEMCALLKKHGLTSYTYIDGGVEYVVELDTTEKLTVSKADGEDD